MHYFMPKKQLNCTCHVMLQVGCEDLEEHEVLEAVRYQSACRSDKEMTSYNNFIDLLSSEF